MYKLILLIYVIAAVCLVALVLVQQGKGATMGATFGSGASQTVFGSRGSGSFLFRITMGFMLLFFATCVGLNYMATSASKQPQVINLPVSSAPPPPAPPTTGTDQTSLPSEIPVRQ